MLRFINFFFVVSNLLLIPWSRFFYSVILVFFSTCSIWVFQKLSSFSLSIIFMLSLIILENICNIYNSFLKKGLCANLSSLLCLGLLQVVGFSLDYDSSFFSVFHAFYFLIGCWTLFSIVGWYILLKSWPFFWYTQVILDQFDLFEACFSFLSQVLSKLFIRDNLVLPQRWKTSESYIKFPVNYMVSPH